MADADAALLAVLEEGQRIGAIGTTEPHDALAHARRFELALPRTCSRVLDLGSGGGLPGLVIAWDHPDLHVTLVDRRSKRTDHLRRAVARLSLGARVTVVTADARVLASDPAHAGSYDVVTARSFGPPADTVRMALPFLVPGGMVVISVPPDGGDDLGVVGAGVPVELMAANSSMPGLARFRAR